MESSTSLDAFSSANVPVTVTAHGKLSVNSSGSNSIWVNIRQILIVFSIEAGRTNAVMSTLMPENSLLIAKLIATAVSLR